MNFIFQNNFGDKKSQKTNSEGFRLKDYTEDAQLDNPHELHIHTWLDANLREITNALKTAVKCANDKDARLHFSHVFQDSSGNFRLT